MSGTPRTLLHAVGLTALAIAATFGLDPYRNYLLALVAAYLCATAGLALLVGRTGQLSLGHAALMAAGGYGYALTVDVLPGPAAVQVIGALVVGVLLAAAVGLALGLAGARLHGPYLAGITLALGMALPSVASMVPALRGDQGLGVGYRQVPSALERLIAPEQWQAWVAILVAAVVVTCLVLVDRGRTGVRMRAVRDDEVAAALAGVAPGRVKVLAFVLSAAAAGAGGGVMCFVLQSVAPGGYTVATSLLLLVGVVVGGAHRALGAALGAVLVVLLPWLVSLAVDAMALPAATSQRLEANLPVLLFGGLLIVLTALAPRGIVGELDARRARRRGRRAALASAPAAVGQDAETPDDAPNPHDLVTIPAAPAAGSATPTED